MIIIYTDGASQGNPGISGAGIFIKDDKNIYEYSIPLGSMSNHEAEFHAVIHALKICEKYFSGRILSFRTDSQVVVDTVEKDYTNNNDFLPLLNEIRKHSKHFPYIFMKWIPANHNNHADQLAKSALHKN